MAREGLSTEEKKARALLDAEKEATDAIEDGDYVGVIFDQNEFRPIPETTNEKSKPELDINCINANSIGYAPATLKVKSFEGGNMLSKIPTGRKMKYMMYIYNIKIM